MLAFALLLVPLVRAAAVDTLGALSANPPQAERLERTDELGAAVANVVSALENVAASARSECEVALALLATRAHAAGRADLLATIGEALATADVLISRPVHLLARDLAQGCERDDAWGFAMFELAAACSYARHLDAADAYLALGRGHAYDDEELRLYEFILAAEIASARGDVATAKSEVAALRVRVALVEEPPSFVAQALANLGHVEFAVGEFSASAATWERAIAAAEASNNTAALRLALSDRCNLQRLREDHVALLADAERLVALVQDPRLAADPEDRFIAHYTRGTARLRTDSHVEALVDFASALAWARTPPGRPASEAAALDGLALAMLARGDTATARTLVDQALTIERRLDENEYLLHTLQTLAALELAVGRPVAARAAADEASVLLERDRSEGVGPHALVARRSRYSQWSELEQDIAALAFLGATTDQERTAAVEDGLASAARWTGRSLSLALTEPGPEREPSASAVASSLADGEVLVHFANSRDRLYAYVVRRDATRLHDLGPRADTEALCAAFVSDVLVRATCVSPTDVAERGAELFERLLAPLALDDEHTQRIVVVPTPELATLPFEALAMRRVSADVADFSEVAFALDRWEFVVCPSLALACREIVVETQLSASGVFLGDAHFARNEGSAPARLIASRREVATAVDALLPAEGDDRARFDALDVTGTRDLEFRSASGVVLLIGSTANPSALQTVTGDIGVLHVATHANEERLDPTALGLLLSPDASGDALLTVDEIRALPFRPQLVLLSACSTAAGPLVGGDGLQSIANAFLELGTREVVASVCPVPDDDACFLMSEFHRRRTAGASTSDALRGAKLAQRSAGTSTPSPTRHPGLGARASAPRSVPPGHPSSWALFVLIGS